VPAVELMARILLASALAAGVAGVVPLVPRSTATSAPHGHAATEGGDGTTRTFFIAADQVAWNYAPARRDLITGRRFGAAEDVFVKRGVHRIGSTYLKSLFRAYTDATFRRRAAVPAQWRHLGFLGPVIQAQVGDTIVVHFKNNTPFATGMHPHGVAYAKSSEGALYADGTSGRDKADDAVPPGGTHTYIWHVPERAGPGPGDASSVMWMYHGHTDEVADTYAGLLGPIIITRRGMARADGSPRDVDRQLVALFEVVDENQSPYLARNIRGYADRPRSVDVETDAFVESNLMHAINGFVYGNGPQFAMKRGERVRWYVMGMGTEVDLHSPHWHGNVITTSMGMRMDTVSLLPGEMVQADMTPDSPGVWLFHCHVNDHILAGMQSRFRVE
jgi:FtsP/CotA-like multicopper oxidase with cupredoxin domain